MKRKIDMIFTKYIFLNVRETWIGFLGIAKLLYYAFYYLIKIL